MNSAADLSTPIEFGLLLIPGYQWLDAAGPIDYLSQHSRAALIATGLPPSVTDKAPLINFHYISSTGTMDPVAATSGPMGLPTTTFGKCPQLDYLLVPGPDPMHVLSEECIAWVKEQYEGVKALLTICGGSLVLVQTGIFDGLRAATNKWALSELVKRGVYAGSRYSRVKWVVDERFVVEGKIWSSAGVTTGIDLAAEFARMHFDEGIVKLVGEMMEHEAIGKKPDPFAYLLDGVLL